MRLGGSRRKPPQHTVGTAQNQDAVRHSNPGVGGRKDACFQPRMQDSHFMDVSVLTQICAKEAALPHWGASTFSSVLFFY